MVISKKMVTICRRCALQCGQIRPTQPNVPNYVIPSQISFAFDKASKFVKLRFSFPFLIRRLHEIEE